MIRFDGVTFTYPDAPGPALGPLTLRIPEGELCLVVGPTGSGKSTLLQLVNGLAPHFTGGLLQGTVTVFGRDTRLNRPRDLADLIGVVGQDPAAGFVTDTVDEELAYGMEQLGLPAAVMRTRVEDIVDLLGLEPLRGRALADLSGGEQQRVALGAVMTSHPRVLVLDEPTSALDPTAAEEVLAAISRLVQDVGMTVLLAEHRLERVAQFADSAIHIHSDGTATHGPTAQVLAGSPITPPVIELGRLLGWDPLPLSVRDARRQAETLRARLHESTAPSPPTPASTAGVVLTARALRVRHGSTQALDAVDLSLRAGEIVAVMGRNGSGKSSLLWALQGTGRRAGGTVRLAVPNGLVPTGQRRTRPNPVRAFAAFRAFRRVGEPTSAGTTDGAVDPATVQADAARRQIALVPQSPADLLYLDTVAAECAESDRQSVLVSGSTAVVLSRLAPGIPPDRHPRDLSEGQRLALVLAIQSAACPRILLLDEPTRGLDYATKRRVTDEVQTLAAGGGSVLLSSHDVEFVAGVADRVIVLAHGEVVADGPALELLSASPSFAPQVAKILRPMPLLTVDAVRRALAVTR